jgi:hypothetical protein
MIGILHPVTKGTVAIGIAMMTLDLSIQGQSVPGHLPNKDTDFERACRLPDILRVSNRGSFYHSLIKQFGREHLGWFKIP